jgi:RDD family protein
MARSIASWLSGPGPLEAGDPRRYPGETLGLPEHGSGSLARMGRRLAALFVDWLLAYGLAALGMTFGLISPRVLSSAILAIWLVLGLFAVRLFAFTPGQLALGLQVASLDERRHVGMGRAAVRGVMIALVIPALFVDADGRGLQDRLTATAVVRR